MGKVIMSGIVPMLTVPSTDILASSLTVGSTVKLMEGGTAVEYLVVNQGIPENSSLYDSSCDGTWLLRKNCITANWWGEQNTSRYSASDVNTYLNETFFNILGNIEQSVVKSVKIPYLASGGSTTIWSGADGLTVKAFLLSGYEVGFTTSTEDYFPIDGAKLEYFELGDDGNDKRIAILNVSVIRWWLRSANTRYTTGVYCVEKTGGYYRTNSTSSFGIRPALIIPSTAKFDPDTLILKG